MYSGETHGVGVPTEGEGYGEGRRERREGKRGNADLKGPRTIPGPAAPAAAAAAAANAAALPTLPQSPPH